MKAIILARVSTEEQLKEGELLRVSMIKNTLNTMRNRKK